MGPYIRRRLLFLAVSLFCVVTALFFLLRLSGDPADLMLPDDATPEQVERMRVVLGLDEPLPAQYLKFLQGMLVLDFGESLRMREPALKLVFNQLPATIQLAGASMLVAVMLGLPIGIVAALNRGRLLGFVVMFLTFIGQAMPNFWLALLLLLLFTVSLRWLPSSGYGTLAALVMPVLTLSVHLMASVARLTRSGMIEVLSQDYIRTAESKGLPGRIVLLRHALKNMLIPVVTVMGLQISFLLGGSVIVETIFAWPGIGWQLIQAVGARDYPVVQATVFVVTVMVVGVNLVVDLLYGYLDPRIRYA